MERVSVEADAPVPAAEPPSIPQAPTYEALDPRYIVLQRDVGRITTAVLSPALLIAAFVVLTPRRWMWALLLWIVATALLAWFFHRWPAIEYRRRGYRLDADGIEIKAGVAWRRVMNVPRSRVQHTDVAQGPLERRHGLGRLIIYTAGTDHARVELPGLAHRDALQIRDRLLPTTSSDAV
jgi:membrane protein YdbS with pleckstrin-like domain